MRVRKGDSYAYITYERLCSDLGYPIYPVMVLVDPDGRVGYSPDKPFEPAGLYYACLRTGYAPNFTVFTGREGE